jgi:hypothetical protein
MRSFDDAEKYMCYVLTVNDEKKVYVSLRRNSISYIEHLDI